MEYSIGTNMTLCRKELEIFGNKFIKILNSNNLTATFDSSSFRDYMLQISVRNKLINLGKINIYYKPSKKSYSLITTNIKDKEAVSLINKCWDKANGFEIYSQDSGIYEVFVDGSYIEGKTGYGAAIFSGDNLIKDFCGSLEDTSTRQFGGELYSVIKVIEWCRQNNINKIRINYDYLGIEYFATGRWQPKNKLALKYKQTLLSSDINILWRKIDSHTGNKKNDIADRLAKKGAAMSPEKSESVQMDLFS